MQPGSAKSQFLDCLGQSVGELASLSPIQGISLMLDLYCHERAEGCPIDQDGDMLLYQWGTYDWGRGERFELNITRQFIESSGDEDGTMRQLSLTFRFEPDEALRDLTQGNRWCRNPDGLPVFQAFIQSSRAWLEVQRRRPVEITLDDEQV
jgi:hypothetical protein